MSSSFLVDLNCDMGEGAGNDGAIMPHISSANIACGYHAGDAQTIDDTILLALKFGVSIGAHVSFLDKANFGRTEMRLAPAEIYELVQQQLYIFKEIADHRGASIRHVKPHGGLYNLSAKDRSVAKAIAGAVQRFDGSLLLFGLSGSCSVDEAKAAGLKAASEVFADRVYRDDGSLVPRSGPNALIGDIEKAVAQVMGIIRQGMVTTISGKQVALDADTVCIHGDGPHAAQLASAISSALKRDGIQIRAME